MTVPRTMTRRAFLARAAAATVSLVALPACIGSGPHAELGRPATAEYGDTPYLASTQWLADRLDNPNLRIIDCSDIDTYRHGHIPGAVHVWWQDTIEIHNAVYGMLTGIENRTRLARQAGIDDGSDVVVYDHSGGIYASRFLWMLHVMRFERVRLLDGGRAGWKQAGFDLVQDAPSVPEGTYTGTPDEGVYAHAHDIERWLAEGQAVVLDTRTESERGETWNGQLRRGAVPGSIWFPRERFFQQPDSPYLASPGALIDRLAEAGVSLDAPQVVVYGLHSTLAALPYVALRALGAATVRIYDGSWAEWGASDRAVDPI